MNKELDINDVKNVIAQYGLVIPYNENWIKGEIDVRKKINLVKEEQVLKEEKQEREVLKLENVMLKEELMKLNNHKNELKSESDELKEVLKSLSKYKNTLELEIQQGSQTVEVGKVIELIKTINFKENPYEQVQCESNLKELECVDRQTEILEKNVFDLNKDLRNNSTENESFYLKLSDDFELDNQAEQELVLRISEKCAEFENKIDKMNDDIDVFLKQNERITGHLNLKVGPTHKSACNNKSCLKVMHKSKELNSYVSQLHHQNDQMHIKIKEIQSRLEQDKLLQRQINKESMEVNQNLVLKLNELENLNKKYDESVNCCHRFQKENESNKEIIFNLRQDLSHLSSLYSDLLVENSQLLGEMKSQQSSHRESFCENIKISDFQKKMIDDEHKDSDKVDKNSGFYNTMIKQLILDVDDLLVSYNEVSLHNRSLKVKIDDLVKLANQNKRILSTLYDRLWNVESLINLNKQNVTKVEVKSQKTKRSQVVTQTELDNVYIEKFGKIFENLMEKKNDDIFNLNWLNEVEAVTLNVKKLGQYNANLQKQNIEMNQKFENIISQLESACDNEVERLRLENEDLKLQLQAATEETVYKSAKFVVGDDENCEHCSLLQNMNDALKETISEKEDQMTEMLKHLHTMKVEHRECQEDNQQSKVKIKYLENELEEKQSQLKENTHLFNEYEAMFVDKDVRNNMLEKESKEVNCQLDHCIQTIGNMQTKLEATKVNLENIFSNKDKRKTIHVLNIIEELEKDYAQELDAVELLKVQFESKYNKSLNTIIRLKKQLKEVKKSESDLQIELNKITQLMVEKKTMSVLIQTDDDGNVKLKAENQHLKSVIENLQVSNFVLWKKMEATNQERNVRGSSLPPVIQETNSEVTSDKITELLDMSGTAEQEDNAVKNMKDLKKKLLKVTGQLNQMRIERNRIHQEYTRERHAKEEAEIKLTEIIQCNDENGRLAELEADREKLIESNSRLVRETDQLNVELNEVERRCAILETKVKKMDIKLKSSHKKHECLIGRLDEKEQELDKIRDEMNRRLSQLESEKQSYITEKRELKNIIKTREKALNNIQRQLESEDRVTFNFDWLQELDKMRDELKKRKQEPNLQLVRQQDLTQRLRLQLEELGDENRQLKKKLPMLMNSLQKEDSKNTIIQIDENENIEQCEKQKSKVYKLENQNSDHVSKIDSYYSGISSSQNIKCDKSVQCDDIDVHSKIDIYCQTELQFNDKSVQCNDIDVHSKVDIYCQTELQFNDKSTIYPDRDDRQNELSIICAAVERSVQTFNIHFDKCVQTHVEYIEFNTNYVQTSTDEAQVVIETKRNDNFSASNELIENNEITLSKLNQNQSIQMSSQNVTQTARQDSSINIENSFVAEKEMQRQNDGNNLLNDQLNVSVIENLQTADLWNHDEELLKNINTKSTEKLIAFLKDEVQCHRKIIQQKDDEIGYLKTLRNQLQDELLMSGSQIKESNMEFLNLKETVQAIKTEKDLLEQKGEEMKIQLEDFKSFIYYIANDLKLMHENDESDINDKDDAVIIVDNIDSCDASIPTNGSSTKNCLKENLDKEIRYLINLLKKRDLKLNSAFNKIDQLSIELCQRGNYKGLQMSSTNNIPFDDANTNEDILSLSNDETNNQKLDVINQLQDLIEKKNREIEDLKCRLYVATDQLIHFRVLFSDNNVFENGLKLNNGMSSEESDDTDPDQIITSPGDNTIIRIDSSFPNSSRKLFDQYQKSHWQEIVSQLHSWIAQLKTYSRRHSILRLHKQPRFDIKTFSIIYLLLIHVLLIRCLL